jgi:hypothetical protein
MWKCLNEECQRTFDRPAKQYGEIRYTEVCPYCEYDELERISICTKCGEPSEYLESLCGGCKGIIRDTFREPLRFLTEEYGFELSDVADEFTYLVEREGRTMETDKPTWQLVGGKL